MSPTLAAFSISSSSTCCLRSSVRNLAEEGLERETAEEWVKMTLLPNLSSLLAHQLEMWKGEGDAFSFFWHKLETEKCGNFHSMSVLERGNWKTCCVVRCCNEKYKNDRGEQWNQMISIKASVLKFLSTCKIGRYYQDCANTLFWLILLRWNIKIFVKLRFLPWIKFSLWSNKLK